MTRITCVQLIPEMTPELGQGKGQSTVTQIGCAALQTVCNSVVATKATRQNRAVGKGNFLLPLYRLSVKPIRRTQGGNACAAAAYRSGTKIGKFDYSNRRGVADRALFLPKDAPDWGRVRLWQEAEEAEKRKNSVVAREVLLALPHEMPLEGHRKAVEAFCNWLVGRYQVAADAALHTPKKGHDARNIHAHILMTTRRLSAQGLTEKTRELDDKITGPLEIEAMRQEWCFILKNAGFNLEHRAAYRSKAVCKTPHPAPGRKIQAVRNDSAPPPCLSL